MVTLHSKSEDKSTHENNNEYRTNVIKQKQQIKRQCIDEYPTRKQATKGKNAAPI